MVSRCGAVISPLRNIFGVLVWGEGIVVWRWYDVLLQI